MRTFSSFTFDVVEKLFGIQEASNLPILDEWTKASINTSNPLGFVLDMLKKHLLEKAHIWNEDELKMFFIGPLVELAELGTNIFQPFTQRSFSVVYNGEEIGGRVDFMVAKGRRVPEQPYFCIHEYKQETDKEGDPLGQLLIAMVAAQIVNEYKFPILGAYVIGRNWFFVTLEENQYAKTDAYVASSEDIFQIFAMLRKSKEIMQRFI